MSKDNVRSLIDYCLCSTLSKINYVSREIIKRNTMTDSFAFIFQEDFRFGLIDFE